MEKDLFQKGLWVLVVEDETLIAFLLEDMIVELGAEFVGPFVSLATAVEAAGKDDFDVAMIDMHLGAERADAVAALLSQRGIPFALASGGDEAGLGLGQSAVLQKPFSFDDIAQTLKRLDEARTG